MDLLSSGLLESPSIASIAVPMSFLEARARTGLYPAPKASPNVEFRFISDVPFPGLDLDRDLDVGC